MPSRRKLRLAACAAPLVVGLGVAMIISCKDTTRPSTATVLADNGSMADIGSEHNRALADFQVALGTPGFAKRNFCGFLVDFSGQKERYPARLRTANFSETRSFLRRAAASRSACHPSRISPVVYSADLVLTRQFSSELSQKLSEVEVAINDAADESDLSLRLDGIVGIDQLPPDERAAVEAAVSVAKASFSYWHNQWPGFAAQVVMTYGGCATERAGLGDGESQALDYCLNGGAVPAAFRAVPWSGQEFLFASLRQDECEYTPYRYWNMIVMSDTRGAAAGAFAGYRAGGYQGAALGGLGGAMFYSIYDSIPWIWRQYWCVIHRTAR
jgi:hypothetical protein